MTNSANIKNIILFGPPGAGKGTQAEKLISLMGFEKVATGDFARELMNEESERGERVREAMKNGQLAPNEIINEYVAEKISNFDENKGILFDGFPRDLAQAEELEKIMEKAGRIIDKVFYIKCDEEGLIKRLEKRRLCTECGKITDTAGETCPSCGGKLIQRRDDEPEVIKKRLVEYNEKTKPVIDYFKEKGLIVEVNGDQPIEDVHKEIIQNLR